MTAANLRFTQANQLGFLGFSDEWSVNPEFTLAILPDSQLINTGNKVKDKIHAANMPMAVT